MVCVSSPVKSIVEHLVVCVCTVCVFCMYVYVCVFHVYMYVCVFCVYMYVCVFHVYMYVRMCVLYICMYVFSHHVRYPLPTEKCRPCSLDCVGAITPPRTPACPSLLN